ncbi:zinc-ribbon domain-containing protein [Clostridium perfringens]|uniref:zinc-ribbon domain-containing protein n=1 Tax=Clostridium perfringens TaxID=1502 RepID=UPI001784FB6F|nr:zinc-ribbon domain-containing protein [Clostridium perfringens]
MKLLMGLFSKEKKCCSICGGKTGIGSMKCADGILCNSCFRKVYKTSYGLVRDLKLEDINRKNVEEKESEELYNNFNVTKKVGKYFSINEYERLWFIPNTIWDRKTPKIYSFDDIISFELIEDNDCIVKGGLGRAIVGGALLGGVGAVVGGTTGKKISKKVITKLIIKITVNNIENPVVYINLLETPTQAASITYKNKFKLAQEILSLLELIVKQCEITSTDEIKKENDMENSFIFCRKCGNKMTIDSVFCSKCGEKL